MWPTLKKKRLAGSIDLLGDIRHPSSVIVPLLFFPPLQSHILCYVLHVSDYPARPSQINPGCPSCRPCCSCYSSFNFRLQPLSPRRQRAVEGTVVVCTSVFYHKAFNKSQLTFFRCHAAAAVRTSSLGLNGPASHVRHVGAHA